MDPDGSRKSHQSKFVKQLCYYTIVVSLQIWSVLNLFKTFFPMFILSMTVLILIETTTGDIITIRDNKGIGHEIKSTTVLVALGIGWFAFTLSFFFNILYYALHPSQVTLSFLIKYLTIFFLQIDLLNIRDKLVVSMFGYEINLLQWSVKGLEINLPNKKIKSNTSDLICDLKENKKKLELPHDAEGNLELVVTT